MSSNGSLRTDDLALAVVLIMNGEKYTLERGVQRHRGYMRPVCTWVFRPTELALSLSRKYEAGLATVEPNRFVEVWGVVRKEMYIFLDIT